MDLLLGFILLGSIGLFRMLPCVLSITIACDTTFTGRERDIKILMRLLIFVISGGVNLALYFLLHHYLLGRWNVITTAKDIVRFRFGYQDLDYFLYSLVICTVFAIVLGFVLKLVLAKILSGEYGQTCLAARRKIFIFLALSFTGIVAILLYDFKISGQRGVVINEVCSSNRSFVLYDGTASDYVELYNPGVLSCQLSQLYLSDDENNLKKTEIPFIVIPAGDFATVSLAQSSFSLSRHGDETVFLSDAKGRILDQVSVGTLETDFAYARQTDGGSVWGVLSCTPGTTNSGADLWQPKPDPPVLSHGSGFYADAFELTISSGQGTTVYYTLDSSIPTSNSFLYTKPITVYDRSSEPNIYRAIKNVKTEWLAYNPGANPVDKAFIVRAIAVNEEGQASEPATATYFVNLDGYKQRTVISLVADPEELWGEDGIYVTGREYDEWYLGTQEGNAPTVNFKKSGREYEVPAYFEYFSNDLAFSQDIGMRISGASSRNNSRKRLSLYARNMYSGNNVFDSSIFENIMSHKLVLRNGAAGAIAQEFVRDRAVATQRYKWVSVFLDGEFWYDTHLMEQYDATYFEERYGISSNNIIVYKASERTEGNWDDIGIDSIHEFLDAHDMVQEVDYHSFCELVDIQSYIDFICINTYMDNMDFSETKNLVIWRSRNVTSREYEDGRWRWGLYDMDAIEWDYSSRWELNSKAEKNTFSLSQQFTGNSINTQRIYVALKENPLFRRQFVLTFMDLVNTNFQYGNIEEILDGYQATVGTDMVSLRNFFKNRAFYMVPYLAEEFDLTGTLGTVTISVNEAEAGHIELNTVTPDLSGGPWSGSYYTDYPISVKAVANVGYEFIGWEGAVNTSESCVEVPVVEGGIELHAIFKEKR